MSEIFIGTDNGVYRLLRDGKKPQQEEEPPTAAFLAPATDRLFALTSENALWIRTNLSGWRLVNEHPVKEEVWSFAVDDRADGLLYIGVSPALLYLSDRKVGIQASPF